MATFFEQLPALVGVIIGTVGTILATTVADRARWKRGQTVRWDERRLDAYADYAAAIKEIHALAFRLTSADRPGSLAHPIDRDSGLVTLAEAERSRTKAWEKVLLLGDIGTVNAAREWGNANWQLQLFARGVRADWDKWPPAVQRADEARDQFYAAARASLAVPGGNVAQSGWLRAGQGSF